ncbi:MAG: hypothetical protein ACRD4Q_00795 [Candidatus Acidiferrales bacterium]
MSVLIDWRPRKCSRAVSATPVSAPADILALSCNWAGADKDRLLELLAPGCRAGLAELPAASAIRLDRTGAPEVSTLVRFRTARRVLLPAKIGEVCPLAGARLEGRTLVVRRGGAVVLWEPPLSRALAAGRMSLLGPHRIPHSARAAFWGRL